MERISLYIAGKKVDLDNNSFILFNYTMEDLSNPTIVKNSFSKQISLKGTPANNEVFGNLYRADRRTIFGEGYTGVAFDPLRKTPFTIYNEMGEIIESGYVKVDSIDKVSEGYEYKVTLYGGLGSFFYNLTYNEEGEKKTLADMLYKDLEGRKVVPGDIGQFGGYQVVLESWGYAMNPQGYDINAVDIKWCNIINFAPAYNGVPDKFSADKAVVDYNRFGNVQCLSQIDGVSYSFKEGTSSALINFANKHTEWEMRDLRWYLQRPIISIRAIFDAICDPENNGGYSIVLSQDFFNASNKLYWDGWVTLPLIPAESRYDSECIVKLLSATSSPCDYLLSFAKIFGLLFVKNAAEKKIWIVPKNEFYRNNVIDITNRVDLSGITITTNSDIAHFLQFGGDVKGQWASEYKEDYGREYGIQKVNTGSEFNVETNRITDGIIFKDTTEVQERSLLYRSDAYGRDEAGGYIANIILPQYESVKLQLWGNKDGEQQMQEIDIQAVQDVAQYTFFNNPDYPLSDWLPKAQFHEEENKSMDASNVLLVREGEVQTPIWNSKLRLQYTLSDDIPDMMTLNSDTPCWNFTNENTYVMTSLPSFRRHVVEDNKIVNTYDWGVPYALGTNGLQILDNATIYSRHWKAYLQDRYDVDTRILKCKVNLSGMVVGQELMRNFFYYDNAIWVLNKISNHSITTDDLTECEFIKVKDIKNYIQG